MLQPIICQILPRHAAITDSLTKVYHRIADAYNNSLGLLENFLPESYPAQVLAPLDKIPLDLKNQNGNRSLIMMLLSTTSIISSTSISRINGSLQPFLSNKVLDYLYNYTERSEQGVKEAIDKMLSVENMAPEVQSFSY